MNASPQDEWHSTGEVRLHARHWPGPKQPMLLLHGLASNCRTWDGVARRLNEAGHEVVAIDQRGHGLSDKPAYGYGFDEVTGDLGALLDNLHLSDRPLLAGQSWGGNVVLDFAARYPQLAAGLVLVDGGFLELSQRPGATWERVAVELRPPPLLGRRRDDLAAILGNMHPDWGEDGIEATLANFETLADDTIRPWLSLDRHMAILRALWDHHPTNLYRRITEPVLICPAGGAEDDEWTRLKRTQVEKARALIPHCHVHWFPATDHDIHVHRPAELAEVMLEAMREGFFADP